MFDWRTQTRIFLKEIALHSPWRRSAMPRYDYMFDPAQLCYICHCIEQTRNVPGNIAEIGVANGETSVFLNKYLTAQQIEKNYIAVDTFAGFMPEDVAVEVTQRGKRGVRFRGLGGFQINKKAWYDATMQWNHITRVRSIQADVNQFDLRTLGALSFCLLDVDLYRPMKKALGDLYEGLSAGGIMVVDDCSLINPHWDGSLQAYQEFTRERGLTEEIVHGKLGVVRK